MQLCSTAQKPVLASKHALRPSRRATAVVSVRCQSVRDMSSFESTTKQCLAAAAVGLLLGQPVGLAEARVAPPSQFEQSRAQEAELKRILEARSAGLAPLTESPKVVEATKAPEPAPVAVAVEEVVVVAAPKPAEAPKAAEAPKPVEAPKAVVVEEAVAVGPAPDPVLAAEEVAVEAAVISSDTLILGTLAAVAVIGVGALGQQQQGDVPAAAAPAASAAGSAGAAASSPEEDAAKRKKEAQAWIAAWRAKNQK